MRAPEASPVRGTAVARLEEALEAAECGPGRRGLWHCPAHDDRTPSLHVAQTEARAALALVDGVRKWLGDGGTAE